MLPLETKNIHRFAASLVLFDAYGYKPKEEGDPLVKIVNDVMDGFVEVTALNTYMVDIFPIREFFTQREGSSIPILD